MNLIAMSSDLHNYRRLVGAVALIWLAVASFAWGRSARTSKAKLQELISIGGQDLQGNHGASEIVSFDVSPDNQTVAVGFKIAEPQHKGSIWIGKWEIASKRLLVKAQLEGSTDQDSAFVRLLFKPDGQLLIAQTNQGINFLDPSTLERVRSIPISSYLNWFEFSGDRHIFAEMTESETHQAVFHIFDVQSGAEIGSWPKPQESYRYPLPSSLSLHGDQLLMTSPGLSSDILLVDSFTGKLIRSYSSGFRYEQGSPSYGIGSAVFIDSSRFVVGPSGDSGKTGRYSGKTLKVFDAHTGDLVHELAYRHLAPGNDLWVSTSDSMLALINAWRSPSQNFTDADVGIPVQLLLFRLDTTQPACVVENLPISGSTPEGATNAVKPSPDLSLFGFRINNRLTIYKIRNCDFLHPNQLASNSSGSTPH
jgi:hypothetical protein